MSSRPRPRRLVLRPGVHVLRRSAGELQVGLDPARALVLPDRPDVRAALATLTSPAAVREEGYDERTLEVLGDNDLLVDADTLLPLVPDRPEPDQAAPGRPAPGRPAPDQPAPGRTAPGRAGRDQPTRHGEAPTPPLDPHLGLSPSGGSLRRADVAALAARAGDRATMLLSARARTRVELLTCGSPEAEAVAATLVALLAAAGVPSPAGEVRPSRPADRSRRTEPASPRADRHRGTGAATDVEAPVGILVSVGEPSRERLDPWMRAGTVHLLLRLTEGHAVIGPFVRPGETACLRCIDAHHTDADPAWPLLVTQHASAVTRRREDTVPEPVDCLLATLAVAWTARELVSHVEGAPVATESSTIRLDPGLTALETQRWPQHAGCGCSWA